MFRGRLIALFTTCALLMGPSLLFSQIDFTKNPDDDLGYVEDAFQESFFEALKQKGIENYDRAIQALQKCLTLKEGVSAVYFEMGKNYSLLKNYGAAENALKKAIEIDPRNEWYLDELYSTYIDMKEFDKAIETVKILVSYHSDYKEDLANLYVQNSQYEEALELLDEIDEELGSSESRDALRNEIYDLTGDDDARISYLRQKIEQEPDNEYHYLDLIYRYSENGNRAEAFKTAEMLQQKNPNSDLVHLALYKFYLDDQQYPEAISSMKRVLMSELIKASAKTKVLNDFVGFVRQNPRFESELVEVTTEVLDEQSSQSEGELGDYFLKKNDRAKALEYYQKAYEKDPDNFKLLENVLLLKLDLGLFDEAARESEEALINYPAQPILYLINGVANNNLKQPKQAIDILEMGLDYIIDNPVMEADFYQQLSVAHKLDNNNSKAESFSKKAQELRNNND